jgi:PAS domain S-box-containing protein
MSATGDDQLAVMDILAVQRRRNARAIGATLFGLTAAQLIVVPSLTPSPEIRFAIVKLVVGITLSVLVVFSDRVRLGINLLILAALVSHVFIVDAMGEVSMLPLFACCAILIAAPTLATRALGIVFGFALLAIFAESWVAFAHGQSVPSILPSVAAGTVLLVTVTVISMLHVNGIEQALAIAQERDQLRQQAVLAAQSSERNYRLIADNTNDLITLLDERGQAQYLSPSHERCLGRVVGVREEPNVIDWIHPEDRDEVRLNFRRAMQDGQSQMLMRLATSDNRYLPIEAQFSRVNQSSGTQMAIIGRDVSERLVLEEELRKAQRMEALGRLAGGVAHDFNNLLSVIMGSTDLALTDSTIKASTREDLMAVQQAVARAKDLTSQLLTFSRKQLVFTETLDPAATIRSSFEIIQRLVGSSVEVLFEPAPDCPHVQLSKSQLEQIVMNFAANARDAMPHGGRLRIAVSQRRIVDDEVPDIRPGDYVEIAASDTGTGIAPEIMPYLFEPFFTTKPKSRGTGLGLASCYGIASQAGGTILVETDLGKGSTFRALLPALTSAARASHSTLLTQVHRSAQGRVLLVDDDLELLKIAERLLERSGFDVVSATTFGQALAHLTTSSELIDILLTDIVLGADRGTALVPHALAARPDIRIVLMSGYAPDPEAARELLGRRAAFLSKPFDQRALLSALDASSARESLKSNPVLSTH